MQFHMHLVLGAIKSYINCRTFKRGAAHNVSARDGTYHHYYDHDSFYIQLRAMACCSRENLQ